MDGSLSRDRSTIAIGRMGKGSNGEWLFGFRMSVGISDIFYIEAKAFIESLRLAWNKGIKQVEVECDNVSLVETLQTGLASVSRVVEV